MKRIKKSCLVIAVILIIAAANYYTNRRLGISAPVISRETVTLSNGKPSEAIKRDYSGYDAVIPMACAMPAVFFSSIDEAAEYADHIVKGVYYDDSKLIGGSQAGLSRHTASTFEVTEVIKGELSPGGKIELSERYYIDEPAKKIYHYWNSYPADPGREYLVFLLSPNKGEYYDVVGLNGQGTARFPIVDTFAPVDIGAMSDAELGLGPQTSSSGFRSFFAEVIEEYFGGSVLL